MDELDHGVAGGVLDHREHQHRAQQAEDAEHAEPNVENAKYSHRCWPLHNFTLSFVVGWAANTAKSTKPAPACCLDIEMVGEGAQIKNRALLASPQRVRNRPDISENLMG